MNTHDYSVTSWGHNCDILSINDNGMSLRIAGWGKGLSDDDYLIIKNGSGTTRYKIDKVRYETNPSDMWFAEATFAPRQPE